MMEQPELGSSEVAVDPVTYDEEEEPVLHRAPDPPRTDISQPRLIPAQTGHVNSVPDPVHRERSFYDQQMMYSRQMQAMGMGAPFMLAGGAGSSDSEGDEADVGGRGLHSQPDPVTPVAADVAAAGVKSHDSVPGGLEHMYSSTPATLYNTQGRTNDFGSKASELVDYSMYHF